MGLVRGFHGVPFCALGVGGGGLRIAANPLGPRVGCLGLKSLPGLDRIEIKASRCRQKSNTRGFGSRVGRSCSGRRGSGSSQATAVRGSI